ncbi:MAG: TolB family protein, partial [Gaiellaceae bacterium]
MKPRKRLSLGNHAEEVQAVALLIALATPASAFAREPAHNELAFARNGAIWVVGADGSHPTQLTRPGRFNVDSDLTWAPSGRHIMFVRDDHSFSCGMPCFEMYTVDVNGSNAVEVYVGADNPIAPSWSPTGKRFAYLGDLGWQLASGDELYGLFSVAATLGEAQL